MGRARQNDMPQTLATDAPSRPRLRGNCNGKVLYFWVPDFDVTRVMQAGRVIHPRCGPTQSTGTDSSTQIECPRIMMRTTKAAPRAPNARGTVAVTLLGNPPAGGDPEELGIARSSLRIYGKVRGSPGTGIMPKAVPSQLTDSTVTGTDQSTFDVVTVTTSLCLSPAATVTTS